MKTQQQRDEEAFDKWWMSTFVGLSDMDTIRYRDLGKQSAALGWRAGIESERAIWLPIVRGLKEALEAMKMAPLDDKTPLRFIEAQKKDRLRKAGIAFEALKKLRPALEKLGVEA